MQVRALLSAVLLAACRPATVHSVEAPEPTTPSAIGAEPTPAPVHGEPVDHHSFAEPQRVVTRHGGLDLEVSFGERSIHGQIVWQLERFDPAAPLVLDTRNLQILEVEWAQQPKKGPGPRPRLARAEVGWQATKWELGPADPVLGTALRVDLPQGADLVRVTYDTSPDASGLQWLDKAQTGDRTHPFLYSQSQAIHARSWIPCQDTPGVRVTYDALVRVPEPLRALMAADPISDLAGARAEGWHEYAFAMGEPIPSYLIALAVGRVEFASLGPRSGVWAEPGMLARARREFADVEPMINAVEALYGPYRWGRYDVLVLPPAFPFGGMENPKLTFATPTIIAGDRSLIALIAHELAHSWSGNLATNATWDDLWLNEGFTVYIERRIIEALYGRERAEIEAVLGRQDLDKAFAELDDSDERLRLDLRGRDPDEGLSQVAYEKGALLLRTLEETYGRQAFDPFLLEWFQAHAFGSVATTDFIAFAKARLVGKLQPLDGRVDVVLEDWVDGAGVPANAPVPSTTALDAIDAVVASFAAGKMNAAGLPARPWSPQHWLHFLRQLPEDISTARLKDLDRRFDLTRSTNQEILAQWLEVGVLRHYDAVDRRLEAFLQNIGRRKFLMPLYQALLTAGRRDDATRIYKQARPGYHPITQMSVDALLGEG